MVIHRDYPCSPQNYQGRRSQPVSFLVLHYVGATGGAEANAKHYHNNSPGISAHYFVDHGPTAEVWASVAEDCVAAHCGRTDGKYKHPTCRNANSIGIEMCCHQRADGSWYIDPETVDAAVALSRDIMARYHIPLDHVLRHYDVTGKLCPRPWVDDPGAWQAFLHRLEEPDMTKDEVQALVDAAVRAAQPRVYTDMDQVPLWARGLVGRAVAAGIIRGDGAGKLSLTDQDLKTLSMMDGGGLIKGGGLIWSGGSPPWRPSSGASASSSTLRASSP